MIKGKSKATDIIPIISISGYTEEIFEGVLVLVETNVEFGEE